MALQTAVVRGKLPNNVAWLTEAPEVSTSNGKKVMSTAQLDAVLEAIKADRLRGLWWFLASTGCRKGEALGLLWSSVDLEGGTVTIESTLKAHPPPARPGHDQGGEVDPNSEAAPTARAGDEGPPGETGP
jgi:integrase